MNWRGIAAVLKRSRTQSAVACFVLIHSLTTPICASPKEVPALYPLARGSLQGGDRKYGFVDATGHFAIPPQFDQVRKYVDGRAQITIGKKVGFIDELGLASCAADL